MSDVINATELKRIDNKTVNLVNGFVHNTQKLLPINNAYYTIPESINRMILMFYFIDNNIFDVCNTNKNVINDNGRIFRLKSFGRGYINAGDSNGKKSGTFAIKINDMTIGKYVYIGITSDISNCTKDQSMGHYRKGNTYFVYGSKGWGYGKTSRTIGYKDCFAFKGWNKGDITKMVWNEKGELIYFINDKQIGTINIQTGLTYHPCVGRIADDMELEIV